MTCPKCNVELQILRDENTELRRQIAYEINTQIAERLRLVFGLTKQQGAILEALRGADGRIVTVAGLDAFLDHTVAYDENSASTLVKTHICNIRRLVGKEVITTVLGCGYRLSPIGRLALSEALEKAGYFRRECA